MTKFRTYNPPAVVVVAYNREKSLERLLSSLDKAYYDHPVTLIISIDGGGGQEVVKCAERFQWQHGEKEIILHPGNLGLKQHILSCGDLTSRFDSTVILEDDLLVSPWYYRYSSLARQFYHAEHKIAGISLFAWSFNFLANTPFIPIQDKYDVYFMQKANSWGQLWTADQWQSFRAWYDKVDGDFDTHLLPKTIKDWPDKSWAKYYNYYLVSTGKYFVYPRFSLSVNLTEPGENFDHSAPWFQSTLLLAEKSFEFRPFEKSAIRYDAFFELDKHTIDSYLPELKNYDYLVELNSLKPLKEYKNQYVLTARECNKSIKSFGLKLVPFEMNIIYRIEGEDICLALKDQVLESRTNTMNPIEYLYSFIPIRELLKLLWLRVAKRL